MPVKNLNQLKKIIKESNQKRCADWCALDLEKQPEFLKLGRKVRWAKLTKSEKRQAIKTYYKEQTKKACDELLTLYKSDLKLKDFQARVEWHRSAVWGYNPTAQSWTNSSNYGEGRASGCGYDKLSAAIDSSLSRESHKILKSEIIKKYYKTGEQLPYGVNISKTGLYIAFGGCGVSTLRGIAEYIGHGKTFKHISGTMFDYIEF